MPARSKSHAQILKSSALVGGSTVVNIGFGIIRSKAMALLLGPSGVGMFSLYSSIADLCHCISSMGVNTSGVRQIAEAAGSRDAERIARTTTVLRRVSIILGLIGAGLLVALSVPVSQFTFGTQSHALGVALLSLAVFFRLVSAGQTALIQGLRRIPDLVRLNILGAFFGTVISIPTIYFLRQDGIVPSLVAIAGASALTSWWYSRKVGIASTPMTFAQALQEARGFLTLGIAFMAGDLLSLGASYAIRVLLVYHDGLTAAGLYQAAWVLGGLYAGFVLQAMAADFYPRLTAVALDNAECNRLINEQAEISILLSGPGIIGTLTFAPLVLTILYSAEFHPAASLLRWICLGMSLRIVAWPIGYIVIAKGAPQTFFWAEVAATAVHVGVAWLLIPLIGIDGAGAAFFVLYVWHTALVYFIARRMSGFRCSAANMKLLLVFFPSIGLVFCSCQFLPFWTATVIGFMMALLSGLYSIRALLKVVPPGSLPPFSRRWLPRALLERQ